MSENTRKFFKDVLLVSGVFFFLSGAYLGFAVAERYRTLTQAYLRQADQILQIIGANNAQETPQPRAGSEVEP